MFFITSLFLVFSCSESIEGIGEIQKPLEILQRSYLEKNPNGWPDLHIKPDRALKLINLSFNPFEINPTEMDENFWDAFKLLIFIFAPSGEKIHFSSLFFQFSDDYRLKLVRIFKKLIVSRKKGVSQISDLNIQDTFKRLRHLEVAPERPSQEWYKQKRRELDAFVLNFEVAGILAERGYNIFDIEKRFLNEDRVLAEADILIKTKSGGFIWIEVKSHIDIKQSGHSDRDIFHQLDHLKSQRLASYFSRIHSEIVRIVLVSRDSVSDDSRAAILQRHDVSIFDLDQIHTAHF